MANDVGLRQREHHSYCQSHVAPGGGASMNRRLTMATSSYHSLLMALTVTRHASAYVGNVPPFHFPSVRRPHTAHGLPYCSDAGNRGGVRNIFRYTGSSRSKCIDGGFIVCPLWIVVALNEPHARGCTPTQDPSTSIVVRLWLGVKPCGRGSALPDQVRAGTRAGCRRYAPGDRAGWGCAPR